HSLALALLQLIPFTSCPISVVQHTATTEIYTLSLHDALPILSATSMSRPAAAASAGADAPSAASAVAPVSRRTASEGVWPRAESRGARPWHSGASVDESSAE